jgi:argininosuccinate lyase
MAAQDIRGSLAHAAMLHDVGVLSAGELTAIRDGLARVAEEIAAANSPGPSSAKTCT